MSEMRDIPGYNGDYAVTDDGRVWSWKGRGRWLKGCINKGYLRLCLRKNGHQTRHSIHRLVFFAFNPDVDTDIGVDHIDGNPLNNNLSNLRAATSSQNNSNHKNRAPGQSGYVGVYFHRLAGKFHAQISFNNKRYHIGLYDTALEAKLARDAKALELHGEFASVAPENECPLNQ